MLRKPVVVFALLFSCLVTKLNAISLDPALFADKQQVVNITRPLLGNALGQNPDSEILTISPGDTLWSLALRLRPDVSVTTQQTMLAIQHQNPEAFRDNNVNGMLSGQGLRIPTLSQIQEISPGDAFNEINRQNQTSAYLQPLALNQQVASNQTTVQQGQLGVVTSDTNNSLNRDELGALAEENSGLDRRIEELEAQLALSQEEVDRTLIQREELSSRLTDLESQIESAQETIRLQDFQLAQLQDQLAAVARTAASTVNEVATATEPPETSLTNKVRDIFASYGLFIFGSLLLISVFVSFLVRRNNIASTGHDLEGEVEEELPTLTANEAPADQRAAGVNDSMSIGVEDQEQEIDFSPGRPITASVEDSGFKKEEEEGDHIDFVATETEQDAFDNLGFLSDEDKEEIDSVDDVEEIFYLGDEEIGTKLELAYAYQKMGDVEGAIEILQEVIKEGNREQVKEAEELVSSFDAKLD